MDSSSREEEGEEEEAATGETMGELLSAINDCSIQLEAAEKQRRDQRNVLHCLATASSLLLLGNNRLAAFESSCRVHWRVADRHVTLRTSVVNRSQFALPRRYWHLSVVARVPRRPTGDDNDCRHEKHVKSIPLLEDLLPGGTVSTCSRLSLDLTPGCWQLPLDVTVFLQLLVPDVYLPPSHPLHRQPEDDVDAETTANWVPVASLDLTGLTVDELHFLESGDKVLSVAELAAAAEAETLPTRRPVSETRRAPFESLRRGRITLGRELAQHIADHYKQPDATSGLKSFVCARSKLALWPTLTPDAAAAAAADDSCTLSCAGHAVTFCVRQSEESGLATVDFATHYLFLVAKLRAALLRQLQQFLTPQTESSLPSAETVALGPACWAEAQKLQMASSVTRLLDTSDDDEECTARFYQDVRRLVSANLPIV